jgi:hypothetical protein
MIWIILAAVLSVVALALGIVSVAIHKRLSDKIDTNDSHINAQSISLSTVRNKLTDYSSEEKLDAFISYTYVSGTTSDGKTTFSEKMQVDNTKLVYITLRRVGKMVFMYFGGNIAGSCTEYRKSFNCTEQNTATGDTPKYANGTGIYIDLVTTDSKPLTSILPVSYRPPLKNLFLVSAYFNLEVNGKGGTRPAMLQISTDGSIRYGQLANPLKPFFDDSIQLWPTTVCWTVSQDY